MRFESVARNGQPVSEAVVSDDGQQESRFRGGVGGLRTMERGNECQMMIG